MTLLSKFPHTYPVRVPCVVPDYVYTNCSLALLTSLSVIGNTSRYRPTYKNVHSCHRSKPNCISERSYSM